MLRFVLLLLSLAICVHGHHGNCEEHHVHDDPCLQYDTGTSILKIVLHAAVGADFDEVVFTVDSISYTDETADDHGDHGIWIVTLTGPQPCDDVSLGVVGVKDSTNTNTNVYSGTKTVPGDDC